MIELMILYYVIINLITFFLMYIDKKKAIKDKWRISEKTFMILSFIGGFIGLYLGMTTFRHKTKKYYFYIWAGIGLVINLCIIYYFFMR